MKAIWKVLGFARRSATLVVFTIMLGFLVLSHTVTGLAVATGAVISALTGVTAVASNALSSEANLKKKIQIERRKSAARIEVLEADLKKAKGANLVTFRGEKMTARQASSKFAKSLRLRTKAVAKTNLASIAGESVPFWGIAVIVGATAYELNASCENMKEAYELEVALNPSAKIPDDRQEVCGLKVPTKDEAWAMVKESPSKAWEKSVSAYQGTSSALASIEMPSFSAGWTRAMNWLSSWVE